MEDDLVADDERKGLCCDFDDAVNMSPKELEYWLERDENREVGWTREDEAEAVGHKSGRRIVEIKRKQVAEMDEDDYAHMRKVVGYVHRHMAQRPSGGESDTRWRYSLMNWGHDPLKT